MKEKENKNKSDVILKIKEYNSNTKKFNKKKVNNSILNNYDEINKIINNYILSNKSIENIKTLDLIMIINHPIINEIYIYTKDQWNFYLNYNLINECIENNNLKIDYIIINSNNFENIKKEYKINKKIIIKYIIKNVSLNFFLNALLKFLQNNEEISQKFKLFFFNELINDPPEKIVDNNLVNNNEDNLDENININSLISSQFFIKEENIQNDFKNEKFLKDYYLHKKEFFQLLEEKSIYFSKCQNSFEGIKNIFNEDAEKKNLSELNNKKNCFRSNLIIKKDGINGINSFPDDLDNSIFENDKSVLFTQLKTSKSYVKELINNENNFKKFNKNEYYSGIELFKDDLIRDSIVNSNGDK